MPPFLLNPSTTPAALNQLPVIHGFFFGTLPYQQTLSLLYLINEQKDKILLLCAASPFLFRNHLSLLGGTCVFLSPLCVPTYPILSHLDMGQH